MTIKKLTSEQEDILHCVAAPLQPADRETFMAKVASHVAT
jgi:hypothetical protein